MKITGQIQGISKDLQSGQNLLTIACDGNLAEEINGYTDKKITAEIKEYKQKRSLNANAFMWELCQKLGDATGLDSVEIYRNEIKQMNVYRDVEFRDPKAAKTMARVWEEHGTGWIAEQLDYTPGDEGVIWRFRYGSSSYNTAQMSRLINSLVEDCKALGIECGTEQERSLLLEEWDKIQKQ